MNFADRLIEAVRKVGNPVLVGIDPMPDQFPESLLQRHSPDRAGIVAAIREFGCGVIEAVAGQVPAVKFQAAYYEAHGPEGMQTLHDHAALARERGLIVLIDGKRNDIGSTAGAYAAAYLGGQGPGSDAPWPCDALTVNPYLGSDGIQPFVQAAEAQGKGIFVLVRTSNPSAVEFQNLVADGAPLFVHVARRLGEWAEPLRGASGYSAVGAVVGATYPAELREIRALLPHVLFLVPGYGAQGGSAADVAPAFDAQGLGAIVNNSRGIIYAFRRADLREQYGDDWQAAIREAVRRMSDDLASQTTAGRLRLRG